MGSDDHPVSLFSLIMVRYMYICFAGSQFFLALMLLCLPESKPLLDIIV